MSEGFLDLPYLGDIVVRYISITILCSLRFMVISIMFPPIAESGLTGIARNGVVTLLSIYVAYGQPMHLLQALDVTQLAAVAVREALLGLLLGFAASSVFWVAEGAGTYLDNLTGYNNVQLTNPLQEQSTPTGTLFKQIAIAFFWSLGGMTFLLQALYESYKWWPVSSSGPIPTNIMQSFLLTQSDSIMQATAKLALPMVFVLILIDVAFGFIAKSGDKLEFGALSQPIKGATMVLMLALLAGLFVDQTRPQLTLIGLATEFRHLMHR
ncbi:type III secretion system export apparatus subunit SctT [Paraburkholderia humisilvae]|uniref:Surface presentation of antigens protein SpaR n=1 Tax=Paraburkholderia humisilvae TaxID=627669 RepID=A0A6J5F246_9BURK|nr:type III secretion system export apparatus subunit SctT [Paraburkholderia humisilvae]CAB3772878.1 hypothetical protein LMG29542_07008 [Paraburkholderia humisilvae]